VEWSSGPDAWFDRLPRLEHDEVFTVPPIGGWLREGVVSLMAQVMSGGEKFAALAAPFLAFRSCVVVLDTGSWV
jgi:hypothetical protein